MFYDEKGLKVNVKKDCTGDRTAKIETSKFPCSVSEGKWEVIWEVITLYVLNITVG